MVRTNDGFEIAEVDLKLRVEFNGNTTKRCSEPSNSRYC
jgi:RecG-like helicase